ncbi:MAG: CAP domain-containing protein, partial [Gemmataceae bacterium]
MIRFQCPHCNTMLQSVLSMSGAVVTCSQCHARLLVPAPRRPGTPPPPPPPKRRSFLPVLAAAFLVGIGGAAALTYFAPGFWKAPPAEAAKAGGPAGADGKQEPPVADPPVAAAKVVPTAAGGATEGERALALLNDERAMAGAGPIRLDEAASKRATDHAEALLVRVEPVAFDEDTPAAAIAWKAPAAAVADLLAGPLHRDLLLARSRAALGVGSARDGAGREVTVLDGLFAGMLAVGDDPATLYPVPAQTHVPLLFPGNEVPDPLPDVKDKLAGYPITVQFGRRARVTAVEAVLEDEDGKTVSAHVSTPEAPANKAFPGYQQNAVCLFAKKPLLPGHRYLVRVRARVEGREWSRLWAFATQPRADGTPRMVEAALRRLNAFRKAAGLAAVREDAAMSKACHAHAAYLARHLDRVPDLSISEEKEALEGYTKEGADVASKSAIRLGGGGGPADAVGWLMNSVLNRNLALNPSLEAVGIGAAVQSPRGWIWVLHLPPLRRRGDGPPVVYPGPGQTGVPPFFTRDLRDVVPDAPKDARAGFPITVSFYPLAKVTRVRATLLDSDGHEVPAWVSTPERRLPGTGAYAQVVLIPKVPFAAAAEYRVSLTASVDGVPVSRDWAFTTLDPEEDEARAGEQLLVELNAHRTRAGLDPVVMDEALSKGCRQHAAYVARNIDDPKTQGLNV